MTAPVPGYVVLGEIARGGMAAVFRARDVKADRVVALKQILGDVAHDPEFTERFRHEVRIHSGLDHPNILKLFDWSAGPSHWYLAMELIDGGSLSQLREAVGRVPPEAAVFAAAEILRGLDAAHAAGVVHRDMKPHNVLVTRSGLVKVADFGISKTSQMTRLTHTGNVVGTPAYMSPEQAIAAPLDGRTDVFSVGVILYELVSGTNPFLTDNPATTLRRILDEEPPPLSEVDPTVPAAVEAWVERLLRKDRDRRPATAARAAEEADALLARIGETNAAATFRRFVANPRGFVAERSARLAAFHLGRAQELSARGASDEAALWEAVLAVAHDPTQARGRALLDALAQKSGYKVARSSPGARTRDALALARETPEEAAPLLRAAKAAKIDRDFLRTMRLFFRLSLLDVDDGYLKGQIASLVARPAPTPQETAPTTRLPRAAGEPRGAARPGAASPAAAAGSPVPTPGAAVPRSLVAGAVLAALLVLVGVLKLLSAS